MGKAARRKGTSREEKVDYGRPGGRFLDRAGLCRIPPSPRLWGYLYAKLPRSYVNRLSDVMKARQAGDGGIDLYPLLWQNRDTAKATYGWIAPISEAWLAWIEQHGSFGRRIGDMGCGMGVHTCFYAMRHPGSEVVGIDRSAEGIARAEELATELGIDNVRFICADTTMLQPADVGGPFDTVTASTFLVDVEPHLFVAGDQDPWSIARSVELALEKTSLMPVERLAGLVADGGVYLGLERARDPIALARWIGALGHAGLGLDPSSVGRLRINGHVERIPALRATRQTTQPPLEELSTLVRGIFGSHFAEEKRTES